MRSIPLEASSPGGSMEQAGGRSAPGEAGDLRLNSFRGRLLAQDGARRFPAGRAGSKCSPTIGWHRCSELERRYAAAADRAGGRVPGHQAAGSGRRLRTGCTASTLTAR
jgi:hypothetical protein